MIWVLFNPSAQRFVKNKNKHKISLTNWIPIFMNNAKYDWPGWGSAYVNNTIVGKCLVSTWWKSLNGCCGLQWFSALREADAGKLIFSIMGFRMWTCGKICPLKKRAGNATLQVPHSLTFKYMAQGMGTPEEVGRASMYVAHPPDSWWE
jgi:hypothetical protein